MISNRSEGPVYFYREETPNDGGFKPENDLENEFRDSNKNLEEDDEELELVRLQSDQMQKSSSRNLSSFFQGTVLN